MCEAPSIHAVCRTASQARNATRKRCLQRRCGRHVADITMIFPKRDGVGCACMCSSRSARKEASLLGLIQAPNVTDVCWKHASRLFEEALNCLRLVPDKLESARDIHPGLVAPWIIVVELQLGQEHDGNKRPQNPCAVQEIRTTAKKSGRNVPESKSRRCRLLPASTRGTSTFRCTRAELTSAMAQW